MVTLNVPMPLVSMLFAGSVAAASELVITTVPAYVNTTFSKLSLAVTATGWETPLVRTGLGYPATEKCVIPAGVTTMLAWLPVSNGLERSVAVTDWVVPTVFSVVRNVPFPLTRPLSPERAACGSLDVKWIVPL